VLIPACLYLFALRGFCSQTAIGKKSSVCGGPFSHWAYGFAEVFAPRPALITDKRMIKQLPRVIIGSFKNAVAQIPKAIWGKVTGKLKYSNQKPNINFPAMGKFNQIRLD
jgi:hypothetical protein